MLLKLRKNHPVINIINNSLIDLPAPFNLSHWWNMGSLLGICLGIQIITGLFLAFRYCPDTKLAFDSVSMICRDIENGWIIRTLHANGASLFFFFMYLHVGRGMYYHSFKLIETWIIGVALLLITMGTAFLGYVLPWGQMSFWGASVITNLISAVPYLGIDLVQWVWGGFSVDNATLNRFFALHFLLPFVIKAMVMIHLLYLHQTGSSNPLGLNSNIFKISFHPYYSIKDLKGFLILFFILFLLILYYPYLLGDHDNFILANPMVTPIHIQPEWYFLFAYAILRSIPSKLGGVIALMMSIMILFFMPIMHFNKFQGTQFYPLNQIIFWILIISVMLLTWIGMRPVEAPYVLIGQILSIMYFFLYFFNSFTYLKWDNMIY